MRTKPVPSLLTPGKMAEELGARLPRVLYVLATRPHIQPSARAGNIRLYDRESLAQVRHELNAMAARRTREVGNV